MRAVLPAALIGRSCHSLSDVQQAAAEQVHYVLIGPLFPPRSKAGSPAVSEGDLHAAAELGIDLYGLGGLSAETLGRLAGLPLKGVAAITMFMNDEPLDELIAAVHAS